MRDLSIALDLAVAPPDLVGADLAGADLAMATPRDAGTGPAQLWFQITDRDSRLPMPARVIFRPPPGSGFADSVSMGMWNVNSPGSATGAQVAPGVIGSPEGVLLQSGLGIVAVPAGSYELFITRGPEWEAQSVRVTVGPGELRKVDAELDRSVDTRGWLAADLHVHTVKSFDAKFPLDRRVISMVTNGVEVIVPTEHNVQVDLAPTIAALGYGGDVVGQVIGNEFNFKEGHGGAYPVTYDPMHMYGGAPPYTNCPGIGINCLGGMDAFAAMHKSVPGVTVVAVNHPWWPTADLGYFTNVDWGVGTGHPLPSPLATAGQFDALEIINGYWTRQDAYAALLADWFYLLNQGHNLTAIGSSDTHRINWVRAGFPRSWLRLPNDRPGDTTGELLATAIRKGRVIASTGPFVTFTVDGAQIGDTVARAAGKVAIEITVDAPGWIQVDEVRLFANGKEVQKWPLQPGVRPLFRALHMEPVAVDTWFVVLASGQKPMPSDVVGEYAVANGASMQPWAVTNPIRVKVDVGKWRPSPFAGLPIDLPPARAAPPRPLGRLVPEECAPNATEEPPLDGPTDPLRWLPR